MKLETDPVAGGFCLNRTKFWITNAAYAGSCGITGAESAKSKRPELTRAMTIVSGAAR